MPPSTDRLPLTQDRVLRTAVELADAHGIEALTMRRLAEELGVEAMSLYYHLPNKEAVLDGVVELVFDEVNQEAAALPAAGWKSALRARILTARDVLLRHRWAPEVLQTRDGMSAAAAIHADAVIGILRTGDFSFDTIHHAMHVLGSRMFGFSQEIGEDSGSGKGPERLAGIADRLPNLLGMLAEVVHDDPDSTVGWCDDQVEFEYALDLILDGLERQRS